MLTVTDAPVHADWDDVFVGRKIDLQGPGEALRQVNAIAVGSRGQVFIPGGIGAPAILEFDRDGRFRSQVAVGDSGALATFGPFAVGPEDDLYVFHPAAGVISVVGTRDNRPGRRFAIPAWPTQMLVSSDGTLITYSAAGDSRRDWRDLLPGRAESSGRVFHRFDHDGRMLAAAHPVEDEALRIFHGRVHTGGIAHGLDGTFIGLHPAKFELVRMSPDLRVLETLRPSASDPFAPDPPEFPANLDPYDYGPRHAAWWNAFRHIGRPFVLTPHLIVVTLWTSRGMADVQQFVSVYHANGAVLAQGLAVPHGSRVVGATDGSLFLAGNASMRDDGTVEPLEVYEYSLRSTLARSWASTAVREPQDL